MWHLTQLLEKEWKNSSIDFLLSLLYFVWSAAHCASVSDYFVSLSDVCTDEDEDILPVKERASTYVHKLLSWRPQCLFGTTPDSEDEDEEKERQHIMEELDNLPLPKHDGRKYFMSYGIYGQTHYFQHKFWETFVQLLTNLASGNVTFDKFKCVENVFLLQIHASFLTSALQMLGWVSV